MRAQPLAVGFKGGAAACADLCLPRGERLVPGPNSPPRPVDRELWRPDGVWLPWRRPDQSPGRYGNRDGSTPARPPPPDTASEQPVSSGTDDARGRRAPGESRLGPGRLAVSCQLG